MPNTAGSVEKTVKTGAEPWNIVSSPDGKRVFVANSGQDTITVIDAVTRNIIGHVNLRNSLCNDPDRQRHFQPRGLAVTQDNQHLYVTRFLSFTKGGGKQGADDGKEGVVCRLDIDTNASQIAGYQPAAVIPLAAARALARARLSWRYLTCGRPHANGAMRTDDTARVPLPAGSSGSSRYEPNATRTLVSASDH